MITIMLGLAALVVLFVLVSAALSSGDFRVECSAAMRAAPEKIFPFIGDFHQWGAWSPWEKLDPAMKKTFTGAASGKGAVYAWEGNAQVGQGRMEITESAPSSRIAIKLDFLKPFEGRNEAVFTLLPKDGGTTVTWTMSGKKHFVIKVMGALFVDTDGMIGRQFAEGLAALKALAEG